MLYSPAQHCVPVFLPINVWHYNTQRALPKYCTLHNHWEFLPQSWQLATNVYPFASFCDGELFVEQISLCLRNTCWKSMQQLKLIYFSISLKNMSDILVSSSKKGINIQITNFRTSTGCPLVWISVFPTFLCHIFYTVNSQTFLMSDYYHNDLRQF